MAKKTTVMKAEKVVKEPTKEVVKEPVKEPVKRVAKSALEGYKRTPLSFHPVVYTYKSFGELIERYKIQNPRKYKMKKAALEQQHRRLR